MRLGRGPFPLHSLVDAGNQDHRVLRRRHRPDISHFDCSMAWTKIQASSHSSDTAAGSVSKRNDFTTRKRRHFNDPFPKFSHSISTFIVGPPLLTQRSGSATACSALRCNGLQPIVGWPPRKHAQYLSPHALTVVPLGSREHGRQMFSRADRRRCRPPRSYAVPPT